MCEKEKQHCLKWIIKNCKFVNSNVSVAILRNDLLAWSHSEIHKSYKTRNLDEWLCRFFSYERCARDPAKIAADKKASSERNFKVSHRNYILIWSVVRRLRSEWARWRAEKSQMGWMKIAAVHFEGGLPSIHPSTTNQINEIMDATTTMGAHHENALCACALLMGRCGVARTHCTADPNFPLCELDWDLWPRAELC